MIQFYISILLWYFVKAVSGVRYHLVTCETRNGADDVWMMTARGINGVSSVTNICKDKKWTGTIMKPTELIKFMKTIDKSKAKQREKEKEEEKIINEDAWYDVDMIVFVDGSDALFNVNDVNVLHARMLKALSIANATSTSSSSSNGPRNDPMTYTSIQTQSVSTSSSLSLLKPTILLSTELTCWIGQFCTLEQATKLYSLPVAVADLPPSRSIYINAGAFLGPSTDLIAFLEHVLLIYSNEKKTRKGKIL
jgi:hypothetical protein